MMVNKKLTAGIVLVATLTYALYRRNETDSHTTEIE